MTDLGHTVMLTFCKMQYLAKKSRVTVSHLLYNVGLEEEIYSYRLITYCIMKYLARKSRVTVSLLTDYNAVLSEEI